MYRQPLVPSFRAFSCLKGLLATNSGERSLRILEPGASEELWDLSAFGSPGAESAGTGTALTARSPEAPFHWRLLTQTGSSGTRPQHFRKRHVDSCRRRWAMSAQDVMTFQPKSASLFESKLQQNNTSTADEPSLPVSEGWPLQTATMYLPRTPRRRLHCSGCIPFWWFWVAGNALVSLVSTFFSLKDASIFYLTIFEGPDCCDSDFFASQPLSP